MPLHVTEPSGQESGRAIGNEVLSEPAIRNTIMSSGSSAAATLLQLSSGTRFVRLASDVTFFLLFGSSLLTTGSQTSTMCERLNGGQVGEVRSVQPYSKLIAFST